MRVLKFGGKSLSNLEKVQKICKYIKKIYKNDKKLIIVVSAMGGTTDELIAKANDFSNGKPTPKELAKLLATGETQSSSLFAMALQSINVPAKSFGAYELEIETFGDPLESKIAYINKSKLNEYLDKKIVCVVAGFQGINMEGEITTLGRGGSDTTATAIAGIFDTNAEIYSDFDGVFSGDPREFDFKKFKATNYKTMITMAECGSKVMHSRATAIAEKYNIQILAKSSASPELKGTTISSIETNDIAISSINHLSLISIIFSCKENQEFIVKNVIFILKDKKFYNFILENNKLSFLVSADEKSEIIKTIATKLKLLNKH